MFDMLDSNEADAIMTLDNHIYQKDYVIAKKSIKISPVLEIGRTDIITRLLEENKECISYLPYFTTDDKVKEGKLVYLDVFDLNADVWKQLIYHKNKWLSHALKAFLEYVKKYEFREYYFPV